nr:MAG TPA: hypothetical protein [Caudoviricetes sp.]
MFVFFIIFSSFLFSTVFFLFVYSLYTVCLLTVSILYYYYSRMSIVFIQFF